MDRADCQIVELRRYALKPGGRDVLIELFDRELVETQEAVGMQVLGQFRDLDDADSFVWLRGFSDMQTRLRGLETFYSSPVWKTHAGAANATMISVDNVLLLHPLSGLELDSRQRPAPGTTTAPPGLFAITIYPLRRSAASGFPQVFAREVEPQLRQAGIAVLATYVTEHSENTFPALPVRENLDVFVWIAHFDDEADHVRRLEAFERLPDWRERSADVLAQSLDSTPEVLRLRPTARSLLGG